MEKEMNKELIDYVVNDFKSGIKHGVLVANLTYALAKEYGMSEAEAYELRVAAMVLENLSFQSIFMEERTRVFQKRKKSI
jgi:hypothetical protein